MRGSGRRTLALSVVVGLIGLAGPSSASAATQVGQTGIPNAGCDGVNIVQASTDPAGTHTVPFDGVLTSWSFRPGVPNNSARMIVWTPTVAPNQFIVVGKTDIEFFAGASVETFATRIAVRAGDLLGMRTAGSGTSCLFSDSGVSAGNSVRFNSSPAADPPVGSTQTLNTQLNTVRVLVAASLEPDADNDGFGDETQDGCPTDASVQGACPDTIAPDTTITSQPKAKTKKKQATFEFASSEPGSTFECSLNGAAFTSGASPLEVKGKKGKNTFAVRAKDAAGNIDPTPATFDWKVKKKKKK